MCRDREDRQRTISDRKADDATDRGAGLDRPGAIRERVTAGGRVARDPRRPRHTDPELWDKTHCVDVDAALFEDASLEHGAHDEPFGRSERECTVPEVAASGDDCRDLHGHDVHVPLIIEAASGDRADPTELDVQPASEIDGAEDGPIHVVSSDEVLAEEDQGSLVRRPRREAGVTESGGEGRSDDPKRELARALLSFGWSDLTNQTGYELEDAEGDRDPDLDLDPGPDPDRVAGPVCEPGSVEHWQARALALERSLGEAQGEQRIELLTEIGGICVEHLIDYESAAMYFERVLALDPTHEGAFRALDAIYQVDRPRVDLIELLLDRVDHVDAAEQIELFHRIAALYEEGGDEEKALLVIEAAFRLARDHRPTLDALERLGGSRARAIAGGEQAFVAAGGTGAGPVGTTHDPMELLQQQLEQSGSREEQIEVYEQMASLWQRRGDLSRAVACLERILALDCAHETSYARLERLHEQQGELEQAAEVISRHVEVVGSTRRAELCRQLGQLREGPLDDPAGALAAYRDAFAAEPESRVTLQAIVRLSERLEDWRAAAAALDDLSRLASDSQRVDCLCRLGRLHLERLGDQEAAEQYLVDAVELVPNHAEALEQLLTLYRERSDWGKVVRLLQRAAAAATNPVQQARLAFDAASTMLHRLRDRQGAADLFQQTLAVDPDHVQAAEHLADFYYESECFEELEPVLEMLLRRVDRADAARVQRLYHRLGVTAEALGKQQRASSHFHKALELAPRDYQVLRRLARMAFASEEWAEALDLSQRALAVAGEVGATGEVGEEEVVTLLRQVATSARALDDLPRAIETYRELLALDASDRGALEGLAEAHRLQGDWQAVIEDKRRLQLSSDDPEERACLSLEIGDAWNEIGRQDEAARSYWEALEGRPKSHTVLHRLLDIYSGMRRWEETVQLCERLAAVEPQAKLRAKYLHTAAVVCRDEVGDPERAIDFFNRTLDDDLDQLKAFEAIDRICTERHDWKRLERSYGRMLKRLPQEGYRELKVTLWHNLGEVLRSRRRDFETAIAAFEAAQALDAGNEQRQQILAELYLTVGGEQAHKALAAHHELLRKWPQRMDLYHTLLRLYMDQGSYDPAWCLAALLTFLRQATPEERQYYEQYAVLAQATARVTDDLWRRHVAHADLDPVLGGVFGFLAPPAATLTARPHTDFNLKRKNRRDLGSDQTLVSRLFVYVASIFGLPQADLHLRPDMEAGLLMAHTVEAPSFVAGKHLLESGDEKEVAFVVAKQLSWLRPELFLRNALATQSHLQVLLLAAVRMCNPEGCMLPPGQEAAVERMLAHLRRHPLPPAQLEQLARLLLQLKLERVDLDRWWRAGELTAERVGLIVCGDPCVAARMIGSECEGSEAKERIAEMVRYASSEDYFRVRREIGLAIG